MPLIQQSDVLLITSHPSAWDELAEITCESHAEYARARGFDIHVDRSDLVDAYYDPHTGSRKMLPIKGFIKYDLFLHFLPMYKYVVWLDADLIVTNKDFDMRGLFDAHPDKGLIIGWDWNSLNTTVICARSNDLTFAFCWAINNTGRKMFLIHDWVEMEATRYFSQKPPYENILGYESCKKLAAILPDEYEPFGVPRRVMEPYAWAPGDFAVHLSALSLERRIALAQHFKETVLCQTSS